VDLQRFPFFKETTLNKLNIFKKYLSLTLFPFFSRVAPRSPNKKTKKKEKK